MNLDELDKSEIELHNALNHVRAVSAVQLEILKGLLEAGRTGEALRRIEVWLGGLESLMGDQINDGYREFLRYWTQKIKKAEGSRDGMENLPSSGEDSGKDQEGSDP